MAHSRFIPFPREDLGSAIGWPRCEAKWQGNTGEMKLLKIIVAVLLLALAFQVLAMPAPQAEAYSWKDGYIKKLEREIEHLTFELGEMMLVPAVDLISNRLDCDDATLYMYYHFTALGYKTDIIGGNLEETNETKGEIDHVWVLVHSGNQTYPYDLGYYMPDEQHYEGYLISYKKLLYWVMDD